MLFKCNSMAINNNKKKWAGKADRHDRLAVVCA